MAGHLLLMPQTVLLAHGEGIYDFAGPTVVVGTTVGTAAEEVVGLTGVVQATKMVVVGTTGVVDARAGVTLSVALGMMGVVAARVVVAVKVVVAVRVVVAARVGHQTFPSPILRF